MARNEFLHYTGKKYDDMRKRFGPKYDENNRLLRAGREIPFSKDQFRAWVAGLQEAGLKCVYCERRLKIEQLEPDHVTPVKKRGGSLALSNLAPSCKLCNQRKGDLTGDEFRALVRGLATFPEQARSYILQKLAQRPLFRPGKEGVANRPAKTYSKPRPAPKSDAPAPLFDIPF